MTLSGHIKGGANMTDQELLRAMEQMMDRKLEPIKNDIAEIKEDLAEVRGGVNTLLDWADKVGDSISFPLPKTVQ